MALLDKSHLSDGNRQGEQAVIVCLQFPVGKLQNKKALDAIFDLDDIFADVIQTSGVGNYDGHVFSQNEELETVRFSIYGSNANQIYSEIKPILQLLPRLQEVSIIKRYAEIKPLHKQVNLS